MEKRNTLVVLLAILIITVISAVIIINEDRENVRHQLNDLETTNLTIFNSETGEEHSFEVWVAQSPEQRQKGLMFVEEMNRDSGMVFVYDEEDHRSFWMKNTLIPLDIIFIDEEGFIININEARTELNLEEHELSRHSSNSPAKYVLELNKGVSNELNISEGDLADFSY